MQFKNLYVQPFLYRLKGGVDPDRRSMHETKSLCNGKFIGTSVLSLVSLARSVKPLPPQANSTHVPSDPSSGNHAKSIPREKRGTLWERPVEVSCRIQVASSSLNSKWATEKKKSTDNSTKDFVHSRAKDTLHDSLADLRHVSCPRARSTLSSLFAIPFNYIKAMYASGRSSTAWFHMVNLRVISPRVCIGLLENSAERRSFIDIPPRDCRRLAYFEGVTRSQGDNLQVLWPR